MALVSQTHQNLRENLRENLHEHSYEYPRTTDYLLEMYPELKNEIEEHNAIDDFIKSNSRTRIHTSYMNPYVKSLIDAFLMYNTHLKSNFNQSQIECNELKAQCNYFHNENENMKIIINEHLVNFNELNLKHNKLKTETHEQIETLKTESQKQIEILKTESQKQIETLKTLKTESQKQIETLKTESQKQIETLKTESQNKLRDSKNAKDKIINELRDSNNAKDIIINELRDSKNELQNQNNAKDKIINELREQILKDSFNTKESFNSLQSLQSLQSLRKNNTELKQTIKLFAKEKAQFESNIMQYTKEINILKSLNKENEIKTEQIINDFFVFKCRTKKQLIDLQLNGVKLQINCKWFCDRILRMNESLKLDIVNFPKDSNIVNLIENEHDIFVKFNFLDKNKESCDSLFLKDQFAILHKLIDLNPMLINAHDNIKRFLEKLETMSYFAEINSLMMYVNEIVVDAMCDNIINHNVKNYEAVVSSLYKLFGNKIEIHNKDGVLIYTINICILPHYNEESLKLTYYVLNINTNYINDSSQNTSQSIKVSTNINFSDNLLEKRLTNFFKNTICERIYDD